MIEIAACVISALTNECKRLSAQLDARSEMLEQIEGVCVQHDVSVPPGSTIADAVRALAAEMVAHRAAADAAAAAARAASDSEDTAERQRIRANRLAAARRAREALQEGFDRADQILGGVICGDYDRDGWDT